MELSHAQPQLPVTDEWVAEAYPTLSDCTTEEKPNAGMVWTTKAMSLVYPSNQ